ncbi:MAG: glucose-6-phosphate isomerase [Acidimicrobiales bacterium]
MAATLPSQRPTWKALAVRARELHTRHLRTLFEAEPQRGSSLVAEGAGIYLDYSKNLLDEGVMDLLVRLAHECGVFERRDALLAGAPVNTTEHRAALHSALRLPEGVTLVVDGVDVAADVHRVLSRMRAFAEGVREGRHRGATGRRLINVVNIGIGGSDLGPVMAFEALRHYSDRDLTFRFVSNVDGTDLVEALRDLSPDETLFIVSSKTFATTETLTNATSARRWLTDALGEAAVADHFVAVSTAAERVAAFGIEPERMFGFWDWVGGRYSMESAIGLSTMIAIGPRHFAELLAGSHAMDRHFATAAPRENLPVLLGLIGVWNRTFLGHPTVAVLPYDQYLHRLPAYLQQLTMESNGKHVTLEGLRVDYPTGAIYWGEPGTNGQHSFYQLLHQGTTVVPADLIVVAQSLNPLEGHHDLLVANALAQAAAFAFGRPAGAVRAAGAEESLVAHRQMDGDRPTNLIMLDRLTPYSLGSLVALYEHAVFVQGALWDIDSFDQWGVELGKQMATAIVPELLGAPVSPERDSSTRALIDRYRARRST